jgi:hypothetical protein
MTPMKNCWARLRPSARRINDLARELKCLGYFDDNTTIAPSAA